LPIWEHRKVPKLKSKAASNLVPNKSSQSLQPHASRLISRLRVDALQDAARRRPARRVRHGVGDAGAAVGHGRGVRRADAVGGACVVAAPLHDGVQFGFGADLELAHRGDRSLVHGVKSVCVFLNS
jgi:hypothetical protein